MIPYGRQDINQADIDSVINVLKSNWLTQGPQVPLFENTSTEYCGVKFGVAVNSATSALHIACLALGLGEGDYFWTSPNSFVASANCGLYCGAKVDFVDIDPLTYNLSSEDLEKKLIQAKNDNKLPKIVIPVHFSGQSCNMKKIHLLSQEYDFKIITTAEGGLATTNDKELSERMQLFRSHGVTRDPELMTKESAGGWYYQQVDLGFNYRMTELQAALGVSQMERLDEFVALRHKCQVRYDELLIDLSITTPYQDLNSYSALHLYPIRIQIDKVKSTRKEIFEALRKNDIGVNVHYIPVHTQPYYENMGFRKGDYPNAENYYESAISIPLFHVMTFEQQDQVIAALEKVLK